MDRNFKGLIWTNHALSRLSERGIKQGDAWAVWNRPEQSRYSATKGAWIYYRTYGNERIEVVAKQTEKKEWIILSVWNKKVSPYEKNLEAAKKKKSIWKRIFGGYVDILLPILASTVFISIFVVSLPFSKRIQKETPLGSPTSSPTVTPTITTEPTLFATASPSSVPTSTPTNKPLSTKSPTPAPLINNSAPASGYSRQTVQTESGSFTVSIIAANTATTKVIVDTASPGDCVSNCPVLSLGEYVTRNGGWAGINGSYFCPKDYASCAGKENSFDLLVMNKDKYYFNSANNIYSTNPVVGFRDGSVSFVSDGSQWGRDTSLNGVLMNYPLLVFGGNITFGGDDDPKKGSKGARSFVANKGPVVYIGVVHNATVAESARVMKTLNMDNALNLDNGGSTALWHGGYKVGPGRGIPNAIIFK